MATKQCGKCKQTKPISEFYRHRRDGYQSRCKDCHREEGRAYSRTPKRREYNKQFYDRLQGEGYFKEYQQRPEVKERKAEQMSQYLRDPKLRVRFQARWYARRMTDNGTIKQHPCGICGEANSQRHHPNYNEPLLIVWLCARCHRELHNKIKANVEGK